VTDNGDRVQLLRALLGDPREVIDRNLSFARKYVCPHVDFSDLELQRALAEESNRIVERLRRGTT